MPLRLALTARDHGPEMRKLLPLIGHDWALRRLKGKTAERQPSAGRPLLGGRTRTLEAFMRIPAFVVFAGLLIGVAGCTSPKTTWQDFRVPDMDVAVAMPGQPALFKDVTEKDGTVTRGYILEQGSIVYSVTYSVFPAAKKGKKEAAFDSMLDSGRDELVRAMNAKLHNERRFAFGESRATELILDLPEAKGEPAHMLEVRLYLRRDETRRVLLYQTLVFGPQGYDANANVTRFLDSFHFVAG